MTFEPTDGSKVFFNDLPESEALYWAKTMTGHSALSFGGKLSYPAYKYIPVTYLYCENDQGILPAEQQKMIDHAKSVTESTVEVVSVPSGHMPMIKMPDEVVKVLRKAAGESV